MTIRRFIASSVQHWQFPAVCVIRKTPGSIEDIQRFLTSGGSVSSQIHDSTTAQALSDVLKRNVPTAKKKMRLQVGDEIIVADCHTEVELRDPDAPGGKRIEKRTFHVKEGHILSNEERALLKLDFWLYTILPDAGGTADNGQSA